MSVISSQPKVLTAQETADLDGAVRDLCDGATRWAESDISTRIELLRATHATISANAEAWVRAAVLAKGTPTGSVEGEEWISGPYVCLANITAITEALAAIDRGGSPLDDARLRVAPHGGIGVRVLPSNAQDRVLFSGFTAEVWMDPSLSERTVRESAGLGALRRGENGGVGVVLGAGNVTSIGPLDALYELVAHNRATVLKLNPTFASLLPLLNAAFAPLIEFGLLRIVNGAAAVGSYLTSHEDVAHVHITGSGVTHDAIVWGVGKKAEQARAAQTPRLTKPITSELGGVSPIIVVPGRWSAADLRFQAEHVASQRLSNGGHNCIAGQMLVLSSDWPQREEFLEALRDVFRSLPPRPAWYPGTDRKFDSALEAYPDAERLQDRILVEVNADTSHAACEVEYFAPVLAHTSLPGVGADFMRRAVSFANDSLYGSLGASIIVKPADRKAMGHTFDRAVVDLRYGTIGINVWSAVGFLIPGVAWGAYPGQTLENVGSGIGFVHNALLLDGVQRSVCTGPFRPSPNIAVGGRTLFAPRPSWFVTAKGADQTGRKLTRHAGDPTWSKMPAVVAAAMGG